MGLQGARILIADDESTITDILTQVFEHQGAEVFVAHNGKDAFHLAMMNAPHCILMDLRMPGMNGFESITSLRMVMKEQPIIVVSAYTDVENVRKAKSAGADAVVGKPFNTSELIHLVETFLDAPESSAGE